MRVSPVKLRRGASFWRFASLAKSGRWPTGTPRLREQAAMAFVNKGSLFGQRWPFKEAIGVCEQVVVRFGDPREGV